MVDDQEELADLLERITCALDMRPTSSWTVAECRRVLDLFADLAAAALIAEAEEVGLDR